jgi:hypothetical protein
MVPYQVSCYAIDADDHTTIEGSFDFKIQGASGSPSGASAAPDGV